MIILSCNSPDVVQYFEYPDHNVLNIGSQLKDLCITADSKTLIAADKGNNRVLFIDVSKDKMEIVKSVWVGSEPTSLSLTSDDMYLIVGLQGASSLSVVSIETMELSGSIALDEDSVFDLEYINSTDQFIVSFVSSNPAYNKTKIYEWSSYCAEPGFETESTCRCGVDGEWDGESCAIGERTENDWIQEKWNENNKLDFAVSPVSPYNYVNYAGPIDVSDDEQYVYILDKYNGPPYRVYRYDITEDGLKNKMNSSNIADGPITLHDLEYIAEFGVVVAVEGTDFIDGSKLDHSQVYSLNDLSHISNFDVGSAPVAIAFDPIEDHVYISPTDVDDNGMFIIEYDIESQLQTNYYQVAGLLGSHALIVDNSGEYIYAAVDDLSDQDTHEPYNGSSFNIQKIKIIPENTYPINIY